MRLFTYKQRCGKIPKTNSLLSLISVDVHTHDNKIKRHLIIITTRYYQRRGYKHNNMQSNLVNHHIDLGAFEMSEQIKIIT